MTPASPGGPSGVLLVDKPSGCTSFDVVKRLKRRVKPSKIGHTGTLDPMATGLLPLCIGEATKLVPLLAEEDKRYRATVRLGLATTTLDREGAPTDRAPVPKLDQELVEARLGELTGEIQQVPPMYSAVRHRGRRMYELARAGITVERKPRAVQIHRLRLVGLEAERLELDVTCSSGTYIRTLAADLAAGLGTVGHLEALTRTACGGWTREGAVALENLVRCGRAALLEALLPLDQVLAPRPRVDIDAETAGKLAQGRHLSSAQLEALGVVAPRKSQVVWFRAPGGSPLVIARVEGGGRSGEAQMRILRVLMP